MVGTLIQIPWHEVGANIATMAGLVGIIILFFEFRANHNVRNIQLMHRCIDNFRNWLRSGQDVNLEYVELLNEELFYFQERLISKNIAIEWIEGILDFIQVKSKSGDVLNAYGNQIDLESLSSWTDKDYFYHRIKHFISSDLTNENIIPEISAPNHSAKKRELAKALYKHIKEYKY